MEDNIKKTAKGCKLILESINNEVSDYKDITIDDYIKNLIERIELLKATLKVLIERFKEEERERFKKVYDR